MKRLDRAEREEIQRRWLAGDSMVKIGRAVHRAMGTVMICIAALPDAVRRARIAEKGGDSSAWLGDAAVKEIHRRWLDGEEIKKLAKEFGVSRGTIDRHVRKLPEEVRQARIVPPRAGRLSLGERAEVARRWLAGESKNRLSREFGVSLGTITYHVEKLPSYPRGARVMEAASPPVDLRNATELVQEMNLSNKRRIRIVFTASGKRSISEGEMREISNRLRAGLSDRMSAEEIDELMRDLLVADEGQVTINEIVDAIGRRDGVIRERTIRMQINESVLRVFGNKRRNDIRSGNTKCGRGYAGLRLKFNAVIKHETKIPTDYRME